jgi:hypothetical protein
MLSRLVRCQGLTPHQAVMMMTVDPCDAWGGALNGGTMTFAATNADACVSALQALSCDVTDRPTICDGVLTGTVPSDYMGPLNPFSKCQISRQLPLTGLVPAYSSILFSECGPGMFCSPVQDGVGAIFGLACLGACGPIPGAGGACDVWTPCDRGLVCNMGPSCSTINNNLVGCGRCAPPQTLNGDCTMSICGTGLYCDGSTCQPQHATGPCPHGQAECATGSLCVPGTPDACVPRPVGALPDGSCCDPTRTDQCIGACGSDRLCHEVPGLGEPCGPVPCLIGVCDFGTHVCKATAAGGACVNSASCGPNGMCMLGMYQSFPTCGACP